MPIRVGQPRKVNKQQKRSTQSDPLGSVEFSWTGWTPLPDAEIPPLAVEIVGLQGSGKTHMAMTFPKPALCDTEQKGWMVAKKFNNPRYLRASDWGDVVRFFFHCIDDPEVQTLVFDSSRDLRDWAELWVLKETGKKSLYSAQPGAARVQYSMVYQKLDYIIHETRNKGKNVVFTSRMKDEYIGDEKTGRLIRDGYNKAPYQFDVIIFLTRGVYHSKRGHIFKRRIFGEVHKIGTLHYNRWPPYLVDCSYDGIVEELLKTDGWLGTTDEFIDEVIVPKMKEEGVPE